MVLGGKTVSGALKPFPWNLIPVPSEAQGEDSSRSFLGPFGHKHSIGQECGKAQVRAHPADDSGRGEKKNPTNLFKGGKSNRMKEEICFINSETGDLNA